MNTKCAFNHVQKGKSVFVNKKAMPVISTNPDCFLMDASIKRIIIHLRKFVKYYRDGEIVHLVEEFTYDLFSNYSKILYTYQTNNNSDKELLRLSVYDTMTTLFATLSLQQVYTVEHRELLNLRDEVDILYDMEKLKDYLDKLRTRAGASIFGTHDISIQPMHIKPEYLAYINKYGYPDNGLFDPELLGEIVANL